MSWAFLAVLFSGWLYVDASYRGPSWQRWLFKPLTLLLLLLLGWNAPQLGPSGYFILCGLLATLIADALLLLPRERMLYAIGALFLSQLLYTIGFASGMTMALYWPPLLILLAIGVVLLAIIWGRDYSRPYKRRFIDSMRPCKRRFCNVLVQLAANPAQANKRRYSA